MQTLHELIGALAMVVGFGALALFLTPSHPDLRDGESIDEYIERQCSFDRFWRRADTRYTKERKF